MSVPMEMDTTAKEIKKSKISLYRSQNLIVGATGSGKTVFLSKLLKNIKYDLIFIFTTTPWEYEHVKRAIILDFTQIKKIELLFSKRPRIMKLKKCCIVDNWIGACKITSEIEMLYTQGRHFNISSFVLTQYLAKVPPVVRENSRYIWLLRTCIKSYDMLYNNQNKYHKKSQFIEFCQKNTSYTPILINNEDLELENNIILFKPIKE